MLLSLPGGMVMWRSMHGMMLLPSLGPLRVLSAKLQTPNRCM